MIEAPAHKKSVDVRPDVDPLPSRLLRYARFGFGYLSYINRPAMWPAITRKITSKLAGKIPGPQELKAMRADAENWCAPRQVPTADGLKRLGIPALIDLHAKHPAILDAAVERAGAIPVWLGGGSNLNLLYTLCQHLQPRTIVETGVANGWSSLTFLIYLMERGDGSLHSGDLPILELRNDQYVGVAVPDNLRGPWSLYRMADRESLPKIVRNAAPFDLVYYDSDKSYDGRRFAYTLLWDNLAAGGVLVSDDIDDNMAFADFAATTGVEPIVVKEPGQSAQGLLVKP